MYPKTSFDRFSDDLTELILSFLPLEDKFRFECLNKRIQSLIYNKESRLKLNSLWIIRHIIKNYMSTNLDIKPEECDFNKLIAVLKKLKAINSIEIGSYWPEISAQLLFTIADHCKHLTSLDTKLTAIDISEEAIVYFGEKLGHKLKKLNARMFEPEATKILLALTPNLETLRTERLDTVLAKKEKKKLLPKLRDIDIPESNAEQLSRFHQQYGDSINKMRVTIQLEKYSFEVFSYRSNLEDSLKMINEISKFNHIRTLHLAILHINLSNAEKVFNALRAMFKAMPNLKKLCIRYGFSKFNGIHIESQRFIKLLAENKQLTAIDVQISLFFRRGESWNSDIEALVKAINDNKLIDHLKANIKYLKRFVLIYQNPLKREYVRIS